MNNRQVKSADFFQALLEPGGARESSAIYASEAALKRVAFELWARVGKFGEWRRIGDAIGVESPPARERVRIALTAISPHRFVRDDGVFYGSRLNLRVINVGSAPARNILVSVTWCKVGTKETISEGSALALGPFDSPLEPGHSKLFWVDSAIGYAKGFPSAVADVFVKLDGNWRERVLRGVRIPRNSLAEK